MHACEICMACLHVCGLLSSSCRQLIRDLLPHAMARLPYWPTTEESAAWLLFGLDHANYQSDPVPVIYALATIHHFRTTARSEASVCVWVCGCVCVCVYMSCATGACTVWRSACKRAVPVVTQWS